MTFFILDGNDDAVQCDLNNFCTLTPICIPVDLQETQYAGSPFIPRCIKLFKCLSSCCDYRNECNATTVTVEKTVSFILKDTVHFFKV